ncbi:hypothetical protein ACFP8W_07370, partial [Nocardioides hankookensis]
GPVAASAAPASAHRAASTTIDDRQLARSKGWSSVRQKGAYRATLSRSTKKKATLTTKVTAGAGGAVTFQVGPGRGTVQVAVGKRTRKVSTAARKVALRTVGFSGSGKVRITVTAPGRRGVYVDRVVLTKAAGPGSSGAAYATGPISQVNTSASGAGADGHDLNSAAVSPDGTRVAFWSDATNLVPGVADGLLHLYVKTLASGAIVAVDRSAGGTLGNDAGYTSEARVLRWNPNGHELLFTTYANNLIDASSYSGGSGPYLLAKDLGDQSVGFIAAGVYDAAWSPDQSWLAFTSRYLNGCAGVSPCASTTNGSLQAFAWQVGTTTYVPVSANGAGVLPSDGTGPLDADDLVWSPDSSRVAFMSYSKELVPGDTNASRDIFVKSLPGGAITRVSTTPTGGQANNSSDRPVWSPDGSRIAFASTATNLVTGDDNAYADVFVKNLSSGAVQAVSVRKDGGFPLGVNGSDSPSWSPDGSKILFSSNAVDLVSGTVDKNTYTDIYVKDLGSGAVQLVSVLPNGINAGSRSTLFGLGGTSGAAWAPDSRSVYFLSAATNLAPEDNNAFGNDLFRKFLD